MPSMPWTAFDQVQPLGREAAAKKLIETVNAGEGAGIGMGRL